jgi:hypothetical protein
MGLATAALNQMLDALDETPSAPAAGIAYLSLHTDAYPASSTNEVTGGTYARKTVTWNAASGGSKAINGTVVFDVPAGTTIRRVGLFSAVSGGTYFGDADITDETYGGAGTYTVTAGTISVS